MLKLKAKYSLAALLLILISLYTYRFTHVIEKELSWDVLGYYLPLPATVIYDDPLMDDRTWIEEINEEKDLTGTLYQISSNDEGEPMYFFFFGMGMMFSLFFFMGHLSAWVFDIPMDGFSYPYIIWMVIGGVVFTTIGLIYFRKVLLHFFKDKQVALLLLIFAFGTNVVQHLNIKNLETVNVLFMWVCIILWNTIKWHETHRLKNLLIIGAGVMMMCLIKPSEVFVIFIPLLYGVTSKQKLKEKWQLILKYKVQFYWTIGLAFLLFIPQLSYWLYKTGQVYYDTYKNPGVGLDIFSPHIIDSLFSYKKGWFVYTPVILLNLIGLVFMYRRNRGLFYAGFTYFFLSFYIITSWTEWWYGAAYSNRPLIVTYPILFLGLGYVFQFLTERKKLLLNVGVGLFIVLCTALNLFQWWQMRVGILDPYRTTKAYYWATFLQTEMNPEWEELKSIKRDFTGAMIFDNKENYNEEVFFVENFDDGTYTEENIKIEEGRALIPKEKEFALTFAFPYEKISDKDHVWFNISFDIIGNNYTKEVLPCFIYTMNRKEGDYGYKGPELQVHNDSVTHFSFDYLTPEIRDESDAFKFFFWNRAKGSFFVDNLKVLKYEEKD
ncbi:glycosyltransferase family 39 protein [Parvicella tangerina]|uniref:Glycosyltransferase RgtA/B/C/D-like domain-containing protein n=1 Tax=Parvicella tangerina TaxID=2829795 RepID=A0A916NIT2_9FLAO|nr:glycosyltransferase family 39 protein [Parvicella tangerina]CAG5085757.1 hypothetical protein CRYO30217_02871 [Parvicella tangerina]